MTTNEVSSDDKLWALLAHLSYFVLMVIGPLVIWLVKKEESEFVADQAKEALNFQLSVLLVSLVSVGVICLFPVAIVAFIGGMVYTIIAAIQSYDGVEYRYPYTIRMVQ